MTRNPCWYQILSFFFFFPQKISKMETKYKKASKSLARTFFFTRWRKKETWDGYSWTHCLYNSGRTNGDSELRKDSFYSILELLVVYKPHGYLWVQFFVIFVFIIFLFLSFLFRCSHVKTGGVCKCASAIRTWVELVWGGGTPRSSDWTVESWILTLDRARSDGGARRIKNKRTGSWRRTGVQGRQNPGGTGGGRGPWRALDPALTDSPMHFVHSSCEVHSGDGSTTYNRRRIATTFCLDEEVTEKEILKKKKREIFPNWKEKRLEERGVFSTSCT